jgi:predicted dehydrogenase
MPKQVKPEHPKIRIGIVGTGQRATAHAKAIVASPDAELTVLCDRDEKRLHDFAHTYPVGKARLTTSLDELLAENRVDGVVITVPDRAHREVAERCFAAGKHCMLEKPMALTVEDCQSIIRAKEAAGRILQIGFVLRYTPYWRKIKAIIESGALGQIMSVSACEYLRVGHSISYMRRWHRKKENSGSFLLAKCSHDLDVLCWLIGSRPTRVASFGDNNFFLPKKRPASHCSICPDAETCPYKFGRQDDGFVVLSEEQKANLSKYDIDLCVYNDDKDIVDNQVSLLEFGNNVRATFSLQCFYPYLSERFITITGSKAYLFGTCQKNLIELHHSADQRKEVIDLSGEVEEGDGHGGGDNRFIQEFIACIRDGTEPAADLSAGLASTVIACAIEEARNTRTVIEIPTSHYEAICQETPLQS